MRTFSVFVALSAPFTASAFLAAPMRIASRVGAPMRMATDAPVMPADIAKLANVCLEEGCNVEKVEELLFSLKAREKALNSQLADVRSIIYKLDMLMNPSQPEQTTMEGIVKSVARLFSPGDDDYPSLGVPSGYSGDTHKGTKDAWDYKMSGKAKK